MMKQMQGATVRSVARSVSIVLACAAACPSWGQTAPGNSGDSQSAGASDTLQEVVVTAERRVESIQKSSLDITAVGGEALAQAGVTQAWDLNTVVPGLQITAGGNLVQTYIRGIGDAESNESYQAAVSYNIDGAYIGDNASVSPLFYDLQRVEVLKGPQGTLYGRNSAAGTINFITNRPDLTSTYADATVDAGNYHEVGTTLVGNAALSSTAAVRMAGNFVDRAGYLSDGSSDDKQRSGRIELLLKPSEALSLLVTADTEVRLGRGQGSLVLPRPPGAGPFTGAVSEPDNAALLGAATLPPFLIYTPGAGLPPAVGVTTGLLNDQFTDNVQRNVTAELNYDTGAGMVTFVPAYRWSDNSYGSYLAGTPFLSAAGDNQQSYELRYAFDSKLFDVIAGFYYLDLNTTDHTIVLLAAIPGLQTNNLSTYGTKSWAPFTQFTYHVTDALRLIGGVRYTHEDRAIESSALGLQVVTFDSSTTFTATTFRTAAEYDLSANNMLYASVSKGFTSGGFNAWAPTTEVTNVYQPETLYAYTIGARNRFFDNRVQLNPEAFYWNYQNGQQQHLAFDPTGQLQYATFNAASSHIYGLDVDLKVLPTPADQLSFVVSYLHSRFEQFDYLVPAAFAPVGDTGCDLGAGPTGFSEVNCSGKPMVRAPTWSGNAGYQHTVFLGPNTLALGFDVNFASQRWMALDYIAAEDAPGYVRLNAHVTFAMDDNRYSITAYGNNLTDRFVPIGGTQASFSPGIFYAIPDAPRTFGVRLKARL